MGTWGFEPFENDTALDWAAEIERNGELKALMVLFDRVLQHQTPGRLFDSALAEQARAASVVVLLLCAESVHAWIPAEVRAWLSRQVHDCPQELVLRARDALERIVADYEQTDLGMGSDRFQEWVREWAEAKRWSGREVKSVPTDEDIRTWEREVRAYAELTATTRELERRLTELLKRRQTEVDWTS